MADTGTIDVSLAVDVLVTWIGGVTLLRYVAMTRPRGERSALESRARFLMALLAAMLIVRGFSWLVPSARWLGWLTFAPVTLLPLAMTVFVEGLLRRHVPRWMKSLAVGGSALAFVANLLRVMTDDPRQLMIIGFITLGTVLVTMACLAARIAGRDRGDLSRAENQLVRVIFVVTVAALPLAATDFRMDLGWPPVRLGTIGILLLCHSLLSTAGLQRWLRDVGRLVARAALVAAFIAFAFQTARADVLIPMAALALAVVLGSAIFDRVRELHRASPHIELLRWLSRPAATSAAEFERELRRLRLTRDATLVQGADLAAYDASSLTAPFAGAMVQSLPRLRMLSEAGARAPRGADELVDLLERNAATHVCLVSAQPLRLLVTTTPDLPGTDDVALSLAAVARHVYFREDERLVHG